MPALISFRSAPAQNTGGSPVRMPTQMLSSASILSIASSIPWATAPLTALRASGRLILTTANGPLWSKSTAMPGTLVVAPFLALIVQGRHPSPSVRNRAGTMA